MSSLRADLPAPTQRFDIERFAWTLGAVMLATGWLLPSRFPPWRTFDSEFVSALACLTLLLAMVVFGGKGPWRWPLSAGVVLAVAVVPWVQWGAGLITYSGDAVMTTAYLVGLATAIGVGHRLVTGPERSSVFFIDALMQAIGIAAVVSCAMALAQWLRWQPAFGDAVSVLHAGSRPYANLGQPNHLATLLGWGLMALWWGWLRRALPSWLLVALAAFLLVGIAASQSRTAWLFLGLLAIGLLVFHKPLQSRRAAWVLVPLGLGFAVLVASWDRLDALLGLGVATSLDERLQAGLRAKNWAILLDGLLMQPFSGYGWQQLHSAQQAAMLGHPPTLENLDHSHNLVLDLLIWNGIPLGACIAGLGFAWWLRSGVACWRAARPEGAVLWLALSMGLVHAMLEYPHSYLYFLLPAGLMVGAITGVTQTARTASGGSPGGVTVPRWAVGVLSLLLVAAVALIHQDYRNARALLEAWRFEVLNLENPDPFKAGHKPRLHLLNQVAAQLDPPRAVPGAQPDPRQLETLRRYSERFSVGHSLLEYAKAQAQVGDYPGAQRSLARMCWLVGDKPCSDLRRQWNQMAYGLWPELRPVEF